MKSTPRNWFITGCDKGMGAAICETLLAHGERVFATALDPVNLDGLAARYPDTLWVHKLNVTKADEIAEAVARAEQCTGGIDCLVNNAGYGILGAAEETTPAEYRPMFEVNFFGMAEVTRAFLPHMRRRRRGHIFATSSSGGFAASPGFGFYAASKFALEGFCESVSLDVAALGIKVTIMEPGSFRTDFAGGSMVRPANPIDDYADTAVKLTVDRMKARHGTQPNDPRKFALVLLILSRLPAPPLRMPLGADSIDRLRGKLAAVAAEFDRYEHLCRAVAFDSEYPLERDLE